MAYVAKALDRGSVVMLARKTYFTHLTQRHMISDSHVRHILAASPMNFRERLAVSYLHNASTNRSHIPGAQTTVTAGGG